MSRIAYITVKSPFGPGETFILTEMLALKKMGVDFIIFPRDKSLQLRHAKGEVLRDNTLSYPRFNVKIAFELLKFALSHPVLFFVLLNETAIKAVSPKIALKNLAIFPKGVFLARVIKSESITHIHSHWASTTSTMAYIASRITNIPWSYTAHRWDITENNLLKTKCKSASFARIINNKARNEIANITKDNALAGKMLNIHMGVEIPEQGRKYDKGPRCFTVLCPGNLVHVKGHKYLIEACGILSKRGIDFKCIAAGIGPLEGSLKKMCRLMGLEKKVNFHGLISHERLMEMYRMGEVDAVVLPSITYKNEKEGIPVALMEAMAHCIPVISTNTGGIPELIGDGSGIMVAEKNPEAIAGAMEKLMTDRTYYEKIGKKGRMKIERDFNLDRISAELVALF